MPALVNMVMNLWVP